MESIYSKEFELRTSDFDCREKLLPGAILDIFQVVAGQHAYDLGCGVGPLMERSLLWVLIRTKYEVLKDPEMYQKVRVKTWPLPPTRVGFQREYLMESLNGEILIKASSDWVIINSESRKIVPAEDIYPKGLEYCTVKNFEKRLGKVPSFDKTENSVTLCPGFSQLDMNGHVNNTKYANYAIDALDPKENEIFTSFQIDYRHEVKKGDTLKVSAHRDGETALVKGEDLSGNVMFACKMDIKNL